MAEIKTKLTKSSPADFLNAIKDHQVRKDCWTIAAIMEKAAKAKPKMWGAKIVGFGDCRLRYPNGREMDWMLVAFSPRKQYIALYTLPEFPGRKEIMAKLGKHSGGKSCVNIKRLSDIDLPTLKKLVEGSVAGMRKAYPAR
ncbi:MAG TPA: DUF1801 domain-containing protein [Candidatus Acidoferrales bacterium]|nr:DUF1801 domain-containing protein [Candidatus Acidoferrales bacterium]